MVVSTKPFQRPRLYDEIEIDSESSDEQTATEDSGGDAENSESEWSPSRGRRG